jgi:hypothetical protein
VSSSLCVYVCVQMFAPQGERTLDNFKRWDSYAVGMTLLESWYGANIAQLAIISTNNAVPEGGNEYRWSRFYQRIQNEGGLRTFMADLDAKFERAPMPNALFDVLRDLLHSTRRASDIDTTRQPFSPPSVWQERDGVWVDTTAAPTVANSGSAASATAASPVQAAAAAAAGAEPFSPQSLMDIVKAITDAKQREFDQQVRARTHGTPAHRAPDGGSCVRVVWRLTSLHPCALWTCCAAPEAGSGGSSCG